MGGVNICAYFVSSAHKSASLPEGAKSTRESHLSPKSGHKGEPESQREVKILLWLPFNKDGDGKLVF